jgi:hypothetical protein
MKIGYFEGLEAFSSEKLINEDSKIWKTGEAIFQDDG